MGALDNMEYQGAKQDNHCAITESKQARCGIITQYYKSTNYGGVLQAYALCAFLNKHGIAAKQIAYDSRGIMLSQQSFFTKLKRYAKQGVWQCFRAIFWKLISLLQCMLKKVILGNYPKRLLEKAPAFDAFVTEHIPHTEKVYHRDNIQNCVDEFDVFLTGSDQVWNVNWYHPAFFLEFVPGDKKKLSYAASVGMGQLNAEQQAIFKRTLLDYQAVSVREADAKEMLTPLSPVPVEWVVDPVFLLEESDWEAVSSKPLSEKKYIFCYFLGGNKVSRRIAGQFAKQHGYSILSIPMMKKKHIKIPGEREIFDASPTDFLSLIQHAEYVFTDSFHAVAFSILFQKQFFVFQRNSKGEMSGRIESILKLFGMEDRFCDTKQKENLSYLAGLKQLDYQQEFTSFQRLKDASVQFLLENLGKEKE